jgi:hypothetical protein
MTTSGTGNLGEAPCGSFFSTVATRESTASAASGGSPPGPSQSVRSSVLVFAPIEQEMAMALGDEVDDIFRREVKSLPAYAKAQAAGGSGVAPPVDEMNQLLMGLVNATQRSFHLLANRIEDMQRA